MNKHILIVLAIMPFVLSAQWMQHKDYWKNRKPSSDYWQQDVHYTIDADINDEENTITAEEKLVYKNNSPFDLNQVYFHLYQNAFQPNSYAHALNLANKEDVKFGKYEQQKLGTVVSEFKINNEVIQFRIDNTILIADLKKPLKSGDSIVFNIKFKTYWDNGGMRRRFKTFNTDSFNKHFDGVHWYPRICVYDRKFGWQTDQHLGKEFYGDYGVFDVNLTFPSNYIVEATGVLTNENAVLPKDLRDKIDIKNYSDTMMEMVLNKQTGKMDAVIKYIPNKYKFVVPKQGTKTWKYHAENVHDFAFTADPSYRIGETVWKGIRCITLAQEQNAAYWAPTSQFVAKVVEIYSTDFGMYGYPKIVAADARDGMEYPMITLNGGNWPGHQYVIAHEVGHNWFFGMIGNNETYRAMLDEGFTQFLTSWSIKKINNRPMYPNVEDERFVYNGYLNDAINKNDASLNTHSDDFSSALGHGGGYRHVYYKTATMLYNLQYVLGDELFLKAMQHYFNKWKFAHPYPEDFRQSIIEYTQVDLNWFFDQWMETTKSIDYKIVKYKKIGKAQNGNNLYMVKLKRKGEMQMPLDIKITNTVNQDYSFLVPNTYFHKSKSGVIMNTWKGWGLLNKTYQDTVEVPGKIKTIEIDPSHRLADIYRIDNVMTKNRYSLPYKYNLNTGKDVVSSFNHINMSYRPDVWFNAVDGLKIGVNTHLEYAKQKHILDISMWYNSGIGAEKQYESDVRLPVSYYLYYQNLVGHNAYIFWDTRWLDGVFYDNLGFKKSFGNNNIAFRYKSISMPINQSVYWPYAASISREDKTNSSIIIDYSRNYRYKKGSGVINSSLRGTGLTRDYSYGSIKLEVINTIRLWKFDAKTRFFFQHIEGSNIPDESMLLLASANMEDLLESKFTRSRGFIPNEYLGYGNNTNHFQMGGGLNLRGYAGYLNPVMDGQNMYFLYRGIGGTSGSVELDFDRLIKFQPKIVKNFLHLDLYLFGDAGVLYNRSFVNSNNLVSSLKADAGVGAALTIKRWGNRPLIQPFTLRFDLPMFLNQIPYEESSYFNPGRWVVGINRSF
jgi:hypothetical protein